MIILQAGVDSDEDVLTDQLLQDTPHNVMLLEGLHRCQHLNRSHCLYTFSCVSLWFCVMLRSLSGIKKV